ncbi:MAG: glycosyltransferase [Myxococcales bacterium]|nr:MAG: glycosyltransferase [Myxococcales bacterium]
MFSLIIPVYKNEENIADLLPALEALGPQLDQPLEVVFVVDGSPDRSLAMLRERAPACRFACQVIAHSRNFGSFAAIRTGLSLARGDHFAAMAADLQEPPELVVEFFRRLASGEADVTLGVRVSRDDPFFSSLSAQLFWALYRRLVNPDIPPGGVDVFGCNRAVRDQLLTLPEVNSSLVGLLFWVGFRRVEIPYSRRPRTAGKSAWTLGRKLRYLSDSVYSFTDLPVRLLTSLGGAAMVLSCLGALVVLMARLQGRIPVAGYTVIVIVTVFFGGLNSLGLGVIGSYVWRAFENTKRRPGAIVMASHDWPGPVASPGAQTSDEAR